MADYIGRPGGGSLAAAPVALRVHKRQSTPFPNNSARSGDGTVPLTGTAGALESDASTLYLWGPGTTDYSTYSIVLPPHVCSRASLTSLAEEPRCSVYSEVRDNRTSRLNTESCDDTLGCGPHPALRLD